MTRLLILLTFLLAASATQAIEGDARNAPRSLQVPAPPLSLGQPARAQWMWGALSGYDFEERESLSRLGIHFIQKGGSPQFGIGAQTLELSAGHSHRSFDWAAGAFVKIPLVHVGAEYSHADGFLEPIVSARYAIPRGGLFGNGDLWRVDYSPLENEWRLGLCFNFPLTKYRRNRPRSMYVQLPKGRLPEPSRDPPAPSLSSELLHSLGEIDHSIRWMDRLLTPRFDAGDDFPKRATELREHVRRKGHTFAEEDATYHRELTRAFTMATGNDDALGSEVALIAESVVFGRVLIPYNRLFGQNKSPHHLAGYLPGALAAFEDSLRTPDRFRRLGADRAEARLATSREVFRRVLASIDDTTRAAARRWKQSHLFWLQQARLVWLPLNYGLRPTQYDTQEEWDWVLSALTGQEWSDANSVEYLLNNQFHLELKRMIRDTQSYQVIILHDFRGRIGGATDVIGWDVVVDGYLRAFADAVRAIDAGERDRLPQFLLFLDEHFYAVNKSRPIITYLENLYDASDVDLADLETETRVNAAHAHLRDVVRSSPSLGHLSADELAGLLRVHVNVTNQFDPSFTFDSLVRDHRKLAFRDISERDPGAGEGILTGQGIGEHYNGPAWEDRSLIVRGPALVELKSSARHLFRSQGFREHEVPECLRPEELPGDYADRCRQLREGGWTAPVLTTMNDTGYGSKTATVLKAATYNLLPEDAFLFSLDSLWISDYWAGMFIAAALRGGHLHPVGPAAENAPSSALPVMVLMRETLDLMLRARVFFADEIEAAGGSLRVGLYDHEVPVHDLRGRVDAFVSGREEHSFLREAFPLHASVIELLDRAQLNEANEANEADVADVAGARRAAGASENAGGDSEPLGPREDAPQGDRSSVDLEAKHKPFIHLKGQLLATRSAIRILEREEWAPVLRRYLEVRRDQVRGLPNEGVTPALLHVRDGSSPGLLAAFQQEIEADPARANDPVIYALTIGSQNQDRLSMLGNGEVLVTVTGYDALVSLTDFMFIVGTATWPRTPEELNEAFPEPKGWGLLFRRMFQYIKDLV